MLLRRLLLTSAVVLPVLVVKAEWKAETIATGLDNPRGIAVGSDGTVYVAESGSGGETWRYDVEIGGGPPGLHCSGPSGGITKIEFVDSSSVSPTRRQGGTMKVPIVSRLTATFPSVSGPADTCEPPPLGFAATGPSSLAVEDDGSIILAMGLGGAPKKNQRELGDVFGSIYRVVAEVLEDMIANIPEYVEDQNIMESNPYGIALVPEGILVADAGADALFLVRNDSTIDTVVTFSSFGQAAEPELSCGNNSTLPVGSMANISAVPTSIAVSPTGDFFVGFLTGDPYVPGSSQVLKLTLMEERSEPSVVVDDLTQVTGLDFDAEGSLFISQLSDASILEFQVCQANPPVNGSIIKVDKDGNRETIGRFPYANDLAVDKTTGDVYVVTNSIIPSAAGGGSVVKLIKPEEPAVPDVPKPEDPSNESATTVTSAASRICPFLFCFS